MSYEFQKFVIFVDEYTPAHIKNEISHYLANKCNFQVWHWIDNVWLTVERLESPSNITPTLLRNDIREIMEERGSITVINATGTKDSTGFQPFDGSEWMAKNWNEQD